MNITSTRLAALTFILSLGSALGGDTASLGKNPPPVTTPPPEENPLSFFDGKLVFDFQERLRFEYRDNNFDFNDSLDSLTDDAWLLQRARIGIKVKPTSWLTFYAQGQDTREFFADRPNIIGQLGAEGDDSFDLRQGYIEIGDPKKFSFKLGRQVLSYGDERLVGGLEWVNQARVFDAAKLQYTADKWSVSAFTSSVVSAVDGEFNKSDWIDSDATRDQFFSGVYFSTTWLDVQTTDVYAFHLSENSATGDTNFATLGTRVKADPKKLGGFDYELEAALQFGDVKGKDLSAFAAHAGAGYVWQNDWKPRVFFEYNYATGDANPADGETETFQNLFPTNHKFYGYMDVFSWQNMHNPAISFSCQPHKTVTARLDYHMFWLDETADAWYRANGVTQVRKPDAAADSYVGSEIDLTLTYKPMKQLSFIAGYSYFFTGDYLSQSGANDDAQFAYVGAQLDF
jgi:hypothetical protein